MHVKDKDKLLHLRRDGSAKTININRPAAYNRYYQNEEYLFEYTAPEGFSVAWEPKDMEGCWLKHETDPVNIAVYGGDFSGELEDLFSYYFEMDEDALIYGGYIDEYSFGLVSYRDGCIPLRSICSTAVRNMPSVWTFPRSCPKNMNLCWMKFSTG